MERLILEWSIRALLMAIGTALVLGALRVGVASVLHRTWTAAMLGMLLLPIWTAWGPSIATPVLPDIAERIKIDTPVAYLAPLPVVGHQAKVLPGGDALPFRSSPTPPRRDLPLIAVVYFVGLAVMLSRLIWGTLQIRSLIGGIRRTEGFAVSALCASPVTIGWFRPVPVLPDYWNTWPTGRLEAVLIHEREHARRHDPLVQWLALLNRCIFWFHPLAWWLERKLAALAEESCDAVVLAGGHTAHEYAQHLIEMARSVNEAGRRIRWAGAVTFLNGGLPQRIGRIMDAPPALNVSQTKTAILAGICLPMISSCLACSPVRHARNERDEK
jgi:hypothetical protein